MDKNVIKEIIYAQQGFITLNEERTITVTEGVIHVVPIWKLLK